MLHLRTRNDVEYLFGDSIRALDEDADGVRVEFANRGSRVFDLVVGADGLHSNVRRIAFGAEQCFVEHLGTYVAVFSMENLLQLDNWQVWLQAGDAGYAIYPVRGNSELRVTLGFRSVPLTYDYHDVQRQKQIVEERLADMRWETPRLLKGMRKAPDFYFDAMAQVRMPRWSVGRVALVGDACYCASPLSGQGTSLALVGAYVLAEELGRARDDHRGAFSAYQKRMRSFVELNQQLATEHPGEPAPEESIERAKNAISLC